MNALTGFTTMARIEVVIDGEHVRPFATCSSARSKGLHRHPRRLGVRALRPP